MTSKPEESKAKCRVPFYQTVDGFRLPGFFSPEAFRSTVAYKPRPDDLFIVTYPKCGTTWMQNIVACIYKDGKPFDTALEFLTQTPFMEMVGAEAAETMKRPGALKVHLPFHLTPWSPEAKYLFVARNPKIYNECCVRENNCTLSKQQNRGIDCMSRMIMNNFSSSSSSYSNSHDGGSATTEYAYQYNSNRWYGDVAENLSDICRRQVKGMQQNCIRNELIKRCRYSMLQDRITSQPGRWNQRWNGANNPAYNGDHYGDRRRFNPFAGGSRGDGSNGFNTRPDFSDSHNYQRSTYHDDSDEEDFGYSHSDGDSMRYK